MKSSDLPLARAQLRSRIMNFQKVIAWLFVAFALSISAAEMPVKRTEDVIYGRKFGTALTLDVFTPENQNGAAVIFMVSGGWSSAHEAININFYRAFLDRGYTVFAVVHGSQPRY